MNDWYSARDLAGLPGMPASRQKVWKKATRERWPYRDVAGNGGSRREYPLDALPPETQAHLRDAQSTAMVPALTVDPTARAAQLAVRPHAIAHQVTTLADESHKQRAISGAIHMKDPAQTRMEAKTAIIDGLRRYVTAESGTLDHLLHQFAGQYNQGDDLPGITPAIHIQIPTLSASSLQRWLKQAEQQGLTALAGRYGNRKGHGIIDEQPELVTFLTAMLTEYPHAGNNLAMEAMQTYFKPDTGVELPSHRTLVRWIARWKQKHRALYAAVINPDQYKSNFMSAFGKADETVVRLNQRWELDSTLADLELADGRHALIGIIEVWARRLLIYVSKTSKAAAIAHATGLAIRAWGIPEEAKFDNGSDYDSQHMNRVWRLLDVQMQRCQPFSPWQKPHIETAFRTFAHDLLEGLPGYIGHDVSDRQAIRARQSFAERLFKKDQIVELRMTAAELQEFCDRWCTDVYAHRTHSGIGMTPHDKALTWTHPIRTLREPRLLDILLAQAPSNNGRRTVGKKGISINGYDYIAPELGGVIGQTVLVLYDPEDAGYAYVYDSDNHYLCRAKCPELLGISPKAIAEAAKRLQTEQIQTAKAELKKARRQLNTRQVVERILDDKAAQAKVVVAFTPPQIEHDSAGIQAAKATLAALEQEEKPRAPVIDVTEYTRLRAELEAIENAPPASVFNSAEERAYWLAFQAKNRPLSELEQQDLDTWRRQHPRAAQEMDELVDAHATGIDLNNKKSR